MNFAFIKILINKGYISSAFGRLMEVGIICGLSYILGALVEGNVFSLNGLIIAIVAPIYAYITKQKRDLLNDEK